jgi:hypothetical protein
MSSDPSRDWLISVDDHVFGCFIDDAHGTASIDAERLYRFTPAEPPVLAHA